MNDLIDVYNDLMARAGASDKDRDLWLAERRTGLTATEIRDLYLRKTTVQQLVDLKLGRRVDSFGGNQYTAWGNTREPVLADVVQSIYPLVQPESRVFHAADDSRRLASPDGAGIVRGELVVVEIKTGKDDIRVGTPAYIAKGYGIQQQWSMRVTGARRSLYVSEQHDSDWQDRGGAYPEPTPMGLVPVMEWVEFDEALVRELDVIATGFLVALDAAVHGEGVAYDDDLDTLAVNLLRFREEEASAKKAKESTWKQLQTSLREQHDELSQESPLARITWRAAGTADVVGEPIVTVDEASLRADHPDVAREFDEANAAVEAALNRAHSAEGAFRELAEKYSTTTPGETHQVSTKESLTVTAVKQKEMKA
ncbi:YqaJ-like recombinase protein [Frigoribacterium sp. PhB160]|uniref:YqaJ viral recombinase family protein n=1 Tax=Frigoribacterium sp. PhB160 TaxID=2485192 RepID=UPI000F484B5A|nr:YqaJ viral recombinase family protein [Frigoribacterium sp. PhB160]ROS62173.1 YqaJ-like recombinase protein [Frigoribacterium sp. PhB160]